jgi:3-methyladenine DNA glycosylase AlkD
MQVLKSIQKEMLTKKDPKKKEILQSFFKTGKGQYAEGDIFYGITVPKTRIVAKKYATEISLSETEELLHSKIHEERLCALLILIQKEKDKQCTNETKKEIYELYLRNTKFINNWDLVDLSAQHLVGKYLFEHEEEINILGKMAKSNLLWDKRIAVLATFYFIYRKEFEHTLTLSKILLHDEHDLMQKAVGWMLREIGKRDLKAEEDFLKENYKTMPRTMLRYAIERFPEIKRKKYLKGKI